MIARVLACAAALAALALFTPMSYSQMRVPAAAELRDRDGKIFGAVNLEETPHGTLLHARVQGLPEGPHAFHIHADGRCEPPFESAGGHFNPHGTKHGFHSTEGPHAGDMPNIHVPASGALEIEILNPWIMLDAALFDDDGAAIVIHEGADDYMSNPAGAAGPRIACGTIER